MKRSRREVARQSRQVPKGDARQALLKGSAKQRVLKAVEKLPANATVEDAIERLVFLAKIEHGLSELNAGKSVPHTEAKHQLLR
jgi:predicted transcriptional regulator